VKDSSSAVTGGTVVSPQGAGTGGLGAERGGCTAQHTENHRPRHQCAPKTLKSVAVRRSRRKLLGDWLEQTY
jgi:hypothetical protein